jgi:hypothetical protein
MNAARKIGIGAGECGSKCGVKASSEVSGRKGSRHNLISAPFRKKPFECAGALLFALKTLFCAAKNRADTAPSSDMPMFLSALASKILFKPAYMAKKLQRV